MKLNLECDKSTKRKIKNAKNMNQKLYITHVGDQPSKNQTEYLY